MFAVVVVAALVLGVALVAALAQDQPKAPVMPDQPRAKIAAPDKVKAARKAAALRERELVDPRVEMASLFARSLASQPAIAVAGDCVYVVKGNTLYQFAVEGLRLLAKAELEPVAEKRARAEAIKRRKLERVPPGATEGHEF
jgi:hypothetical protein